MIHKLLLADRNIFEIEKAKSVLEKEYDVITAINAEEAFQLLKHQNIDMIFADINIAMPDGKELLSKVRENFTNVIRIALGGKEENSVIFDAIQKNIAKICI